MLLLQSKYTSRLLFISLSKSLSTRSPCDWIQNHRCAIPAHGLIPSSLLPRVSMQSGFKMLQIDNGLRFFACFARHWTLSTNLHLLKVRQLLRLSTPSVAPIVKQVIEILPGVVPVLAFLPQDFLPGQVSCGAMFHDFPKRRNRASTKPKSQINSISVSNIMKGIFLKPLKTRFAVMYHQNSAPAEVVVALIRAAEWI